MDKLEVQNSSDSSSSSPFPIPMGKGVGGKGLLFLVLILLLATILRLIGLDWGLPNALHYFSYHVDETTLLVQSDPDLGGLNFATGNFLPRTYNYGPLSYYLIYTALAMGKAYHFIGSVSTATGQFDPAGMARSYLAGRLLTALMGVGTVWAVYAIGRRLWGEIVGLIASLILAVMPLNVQQSHYLTVDVPATFWIALSLVWSARLMQIGLEREGEKPVSPWLCAVLAGVFAGLSAATKYSGIIVVLGIGTAVWMRMLRDKMPWTRAAQLKLVGVFCAFATFVLICPGCVLTPGVFFRDLRYESVHVMQHPEIYFQHTGLGWVYILSRNLDAGLGLPLLIAFLVSVGYAMKRRDYGDGLLAMVALPLYVLFGAAQSRYARYDIPLLPFVALWTARMMVEVAAGFAMRGFSTTLVPRSGRNDNKSALAVKCIFGVVIAYTLLDSAFLIAPMTQTDPRDRAAIWLNQHAPAPTPIGFVNEPWFQTPPINPYFTMSIPGAWLSTTTPQEDVRYLYNSSKPYDLAMLNNDKPPVVVLSEFEYYDIMRLKLPIGRDYVQQLNRNYNPPLVFKSVHPLGGLTEIGGLPTQDLPHDMLYPGPTVLVYTRR